ncbi:MAG: glycoside hydrolase family 88 protein [Terrimonas sp.]|nr:glycoside hydrolase family 88 protein [Terrimonas sp.]
MNHFFAGCFYRFGFLCVFLTGIDHAVVAQVVGTVNNDVTTPLHELSPAYPIPYKAMSQEEIKNNIDKVFGYLDKSTPARMMNEKTGAMIKDPRDMDTNTVLAPGDFRLTSYEWGVTYSAMIRAAETTGDTRYALYVRERFDFLKKWVPAVQSRFSLEYIRQHKLLSQPIDPQALDDAGAVCAAMIKASQQLKQPGLRQLIDHYIDFIVNKEYRLQDGTLARHRPHDNTLWLDDLYMGVPALAQMGALTKDNKYFDDAVKQVKQFSKRMFNEKLGIYMHGWVENMETHPEFHWGRANGWALMAMTELLDVLPRNHPGYTDVLNQFKKHIAGLAQYQSGSGFWHQLLDRPDSYLETSATAIYAYCIAHACNKGWVDSGAYAPMAMLAWNAVTTKINENGQVEGTCVGTGMAFDPVFYYYRPVNVFAAHGYGPVILAGAEMYMLAAGKRFKINDSSLQYY